MTMTLTRASDVKHLVQQITTYLPGWHVLYRHRLAVVDISVAVVHILIEPRIVLLVFEGRHQGPRAREPVGAHEEYAREPDELYPCIADREVVLPPLDEGGGLDDTQELEQSQQAEEPDARELV